MTRVSTLRRRRAIGGWGGRCLVSLMPADVGNDARLLYDYFEQTLLLHCVFGMPF